MGIGIGVFAFILIVIILAITFKSIRIVPESKVYVIERLGKYSQCLNSGLNFTNPFFDSIAKIISLKEQVVDFPPQPVITKDNATMQIDTIIYYQVTDPKLFTYGVERPISAIENLTATTLRNIIGDMELDETLTSRDLINGQMRSILDEATDPWGIKITRVELKNIQPPVDIQNAMEKQMRAERERREAILIAEGEKQSTILVAEGKKQSMILEAEAQKEAAIQKAQGEAEAILAIQKAKADGIRMLREAQADASVIQLRSLEALEKMSDGKATKIIVPSNIQGFAGMASALSEVIKDSPSARQ